MSRFLEHVRLSPEDRVLYANKIRQRSLANHAIKCKHNFTAGQAVYCPQLGNKAYMLHLIDKNCLQEEHMIGVNLEPYVNDFVYRLENHLWVTKDGHTAESPLPVIFPATEEYHQMLCTMHGVEFEPPPVLKTAEEILQMVFEDAQNTDSEETKELSLVVFNKQTGDTHGFIATGYKDGIITGKVEYRTDPSWFDLDPKDILGFPSMDIMYKGIWHALSESSLAVSDYEVDVLNAWEYATRDTNIARPIFKKPSPHNPYDKIHLYQNHCGEMFGMPIKHRLTYDIVFKLYRAMIKVASGYVWTAENYKKADTSRRQITYKEYLKIKKNEEEKGSPLLTSWGNVCLEGAERWLYEQYEVERFFHQVIQRLDNAIDNLFFDPSLKHEVSLTEIRTDWVKKIAPFVYHPDAWCVFTVFGVTLDKHGGWSKYNYERAQRHQEEWFMRKFELEKAIEEVFRGYW